MSVNGTNELTAVGVSGLAEGVREIERVVKNGIVVIPTIQNLSQEKPGTYAVITAGPSGADPKVDIRLAGPLWHNERLDTPVQLVNFIQSMKERGVNPEDGVAYVSRESIVYCYSFEDRRNRAVLPLVKSLPFRSLEKLYADVSLMTQKEIVKLLRITFNGCLPTDSNLISVLRRVVWNNNGQVEGNLQRGKEGISKQTLAEVNGINDFPEQFGMNVSVFENYKLDNRVNVALEIVPDAQRFEIIPFPNELHNIMEFTQQALVTMVGTTGVPTFIGAVTAGKGGE